jgi:hypothetical protein
MSKVVYICSRNVKTDSYSDKDFETVSERITPDNIQVLAPEIKRDNGIISAIFSPSKANETHGTGILIGKALLDNGWWMPGTDVPEGSFALFRSDNYTVELATDAVASRTIWYYKDEEKFLASSSQRALVMLLKTFSFNREVLPWMLSTGTLGPSNSWDNRIQQVPPDSLVSLNRKNWTLKTTTKPIEFSTGPKSEKLLVSEFKESLFDTFRKLNLDFNSWVLPLSGGFDSRAILCLFRTIKTDLSSLRTITWGTDQALREKGNDAYVAKKLADHLKIPHNYYSTSLGKEPLEKIMNRYLVCGEGRVDHIGGYMDGFIIWQTLHNNQIQGIIRGDEGFGWVQVDNPLSVRSRIGISLCSDFSNFKNYEEFGIPKHSIPENLQQREGEILEDWRDRLYQQFRIPVVLAALNDLKVGYVEIVNPLLFRQLIYKVRELPHQLRTQKALFKKIATSISPDIEYASAGANPSKKMTVSSKEMVALIETELSSPLACSIFTSAFIEFIESHLSVKQSASKKNKSVKAILASYMPKWMRIGAKSIASRPALDYNILAFRVFLILKMNHLLTDDCLALMNTELIKDDIV